MGKRRNRNKKLDLSTRLSDDVFRMILDELAQPDVLSVMRVCKRWRGDELAQPDVLSVMRVCKRWRGVALRHPNYYRLVRYCTYRGGPEHFVSALRGAAAASQRVAVGFDIKDVRVDPHTRLPPVLPFLEESIIPAIKAALEVTKKLSLVIPDAARGALYACLGRPAPLLEELHLELKDPWTYRLDEEEDETAEDAIRAEAHTELPADFLGAHAPRLRSVSLSGVRLGMTAVPVFSECRRLLFSCTSPIWRLHLGTHFPAVVHLELTFWDPAVQENIPPQALGPLPESLVTLVLCSYDEFVSKLFGMIDFDRVPDLRVWHEQDWHNADVRQGAPYLDALRPCQTLDLRVFFEKTYKPRSSYRLQVGELPAEVRVSLADRSRGVVRTFYADDDLYDAECDLYERFEMFTPFSFLTAFAAVVSKISVAHDFLPLLYQHFASLPALTLLEIDLDEFRGPFWVTESTKECGDYSDGDRSPPAWPTASKPKRRRWPGERRRSLRWSESDSEREREDSASDSSVSCDDEGYTREENSVLGTLEACGLLNSWDEEPDRHTLGCAALAAVRLRTTYEGRAVQSRQLAHFGRALGFLERAPQQRPQLLLRGVKLASAKYGKLHLEVFSEVVEEPVIYLKKLPEYRDHGYISPAYESYVYSDEDSQASN